MIKFPIKRDLAFTPLFFKRDLLSEFKVEKVTPFYGRIIGSSWEITFGITNKGLVTCWIQDLNELPNEILNKFLKLVEFPDRVSLHFIRSEIEAEFVGKEDPN